MIQFPALVCGIDEAGRGPLAGPVCAAAVILPGDFPVEILNDSKKMTAPGRQKARGLILKGALAWGIGWASPGEIDKINILKASLLAMERAFNDLAYRAEFNMEKNVSAIIDGLYSPKIPIPCTALVKADSKIPAVMAASVLAKTERDHLMEVYALFYPKYGYEQHKGYPTKAHREAVLKYGPSPIQRVTFTVKRP
jgi:ribonuclease HII